MQKLERVNGFLDLDKYFEEFKRIQGCSDLDLFLDDFIVESDYANGHYWLNINGEYYYFKWSADLYEELIVSECAAVLGINAVAYDLAIFRETEGVISKSYRKDDHKYVSGMDILYGYTLDENNYEFLEQMGCNVEELKDIFNKSDKAEYVQNLEIIWQAIEYHYNNLGINIDISEIMNDMIKSFCLNILIGQYDAFPQNWELDESKNGVYLVPFYDGSASFGKLCYEPKQSMSVSYEDKETNNYRVLEEFFKVSSQEFIDMFIEKFNTLTLEQLEKIIKKVEEKIGKELPKMAKTRIIDSFIANREEIETVINNNIRVNGVK